ncbi:MAG: 50S ribosomal protein L2 [Candidatus Woesearchaeota archaeon]|nr:MAG: 50S ribosomal protein L2 [Candidatus Woesearchaeota archaeon]
MGKPITQQRRGKGSPAFRGPSFRYKGKNQILPGKEQYQVIDFIHCRSHSAPLALVQYEDGAYSLVIAPESVNAGDVKTIGGSGIDHGNILLLKDIPEGMTIFNIERVPGDGGKFCRSSGTFAKVVGKKKGQVIIQLPSKKKKMFHENCKAMIGLAAGGGRTEKPLLKAGVSFFKMKTTNKFWPKVSGSAMNAVAHPFGNKRSLRKSKAKPAPKNAPPGRKVGMIRPRTSGRGRISKRDQKIAAKKNQL